MSDETIARRCQQLQALVDENAVVLSGELARRVAAERRVRELEAALRMALTKCSIGDPMENGVRLRPLMEAALSEVPRRSFDHEDPNAPPSTERLEYAKKRAIYLRELLGWGTDAAVHYARVPFHAVCGADVPNQSTAADLGGVTCAACIEKEKA